MTAYSDLPSSDEVNYESWWAAKLPHGVFKPADENAEFYLLDVPRNHLTEELDHTLDYYLGIRNDIFLYCKATLRGFWSPRKARDFCSIAFSSEADRIVYKLRWLDPWVDDDNQ
jgi:hypothetical protein